MHLFRALACSCRCFCPIPGQKYSLSGKKYTWSSSCCILRVRNFPCECVCACSSQCWWKQTERGEAASEPRITLEIIGLCTENYLLPDCSDQSPGEGCGVVPAPSGCGPCPVPHPGWAAEVAALGPSKAPRKGLEVPRAGAVLGSLGQVLRQVLCPCSEQEGSEARALLSVQQRSHP